MEDKYDGFISKTCRTETSYVLSFVLSENAISTEMYLDCTTIHLLNKSL